MPSKPITTTIKDNAQLVVPESIRRRARFAAGEKVEFRASPGVITIITKPPAVADDEYTPEQRRMIDAELAIGDAQIKAGLTFGPFDKAGSLQSIIRAEKRTKSVSIEVPVVLLGYFKKHAKRLSMTPEELMVTILEIHRFPDHDQQLITRAIAESTANFKTGRYES